MRKIVKVKRSFSALAKQFSRILLLDIFKYQTDSPSSNILYWIFQKERTIDSKTHFYWVKKQAFLWQSHKHQNNSLTFFISDFHLIGPSFSLFLRNVQDHIRSRKGSHSEAKRSPASILKISCESLRVLFLECWLEEDILFVSLSVARLDQLYFRARTHENSVSWDKFVFHVAWNLSVTGISRANAALARWISTLGEDNTFLVARCNDRLHKAGYIQRCPPLKPNYIVKSPARGF